MMTTVTEKSARSDEFATLVIRLAPGAVLLSHEVHVMGAHPGRIICSITVPLGFPRNNASFVDPYFRETEMLLRDRLIASHGGRGNTASTEEPK